MRKEEEDLVSYRKEIWRADCRADDKEIARLNQLLNGEICYKSWMVNKVTLNGLNSYSCKATKRIEEGT
jgi:hypothetical protein